MKNFWMIQIQVVIDHELVGLGYVNGFEDGMPTFTSNKFESLRFETVPLAKEWGKTNIHGYDWLVALQN